MATLKHINSKNADYGAAEQYLLFEHDEFTMKPVLDETGRLIPREDYRLSTLNCGGEDFAIACIPVSMTVCFPCVSRCVLPATTSGRKPPSGKWRA